MSTWNPSLGSICVHLRLPLQALFGVTCACPVPMVFSWCAHPWCASRAPAGSPGAPLVQRCAWPRTGLCNVCLLFARDVPVVVPGEPAPVCDVLCGGRSGVPELCAGGSRAACEAQSGYPAPHGGRQEREGESESTVTYSFSFGVVECCVLSRKTG